jgi:hypothetical protein
VIFILLKGRNGAVLACVMCVTALGANVLSPIVCARGHRREAAMAHFRKIGTHDQAGYDADSARQILPRGQATAFHLIAGSDLSVEVDDTSVATVSSGTGDDKGAHKSGALTSWENA